VIVDRESVAAALPGLEIGGLLGTGAFGMVLAGRHRHMRNSVAIKVLPAGPAGQGDGSGQPAEGRLLGRMDHPHIVRVHDYVETGELCLIVMEQLAGGALSRRRAGMRPEASCAVGLAVAAALGYAHERGVLHRDVKPDNVLFTAAGVAKVTDFGVAKILETSAATASAQVGTPLYMAPEQITSGQLSPATDVYALGVMLYHLLSGVPPIDRSLPVQLLWQRRLTTPPPGPPGVPAPVANVVMRALAVDPAQRYPSARAFGLDFATAAAAVLGRGWLARADLPVRLDDDVRAAADGPPTAPHTGLRPVSGTGGPGIAAVAATTGLAAGRPGSPALVPGQPQSPVSAVPPMPPVPASAETSTGSTTTARLGPQSPLGPPPSPAASPSPVRPTPAAAPPAAAPPATPILATPPPATPIPATPPPGLPSAVGPAAPTTRRASRWSRRSLRWWVPAAAIVCALAIVLPLVLISGDGDSPSGVAAGLPSAVATDGAARTITVTGPVLRPSTRTGGTLRVAATTDCDSWDPQRSNTDSCWSQQRWYSRQLLTYKPGSTDLTGDLATAVPTSTDARTWRYTLRSGLRFEDGSPITSRDIKYGIERLFDSELVTTGLKGVVRYLDDPNNPYPGPYKDQSADKLGLKSIETPDDRTIVFHLTRPFGDWNYLMATPAATPVPRAKDGGASYADHPVASGPYKIAFYQRGQSLTLVRNPEWDAATDPVNTALPDRIQVTMRLSSTDIDDQILSGHMDVSGAQTGVAPFTLATTLADPTLRDERSLTVTTGVVRFLSVTTTVAPFDNIHCRKALAWAVDRAAQVAARGGAQQADAATSLISPALRYHSAIDLYPSTGGTGDLDQARHELAACGRPDGFTAKLLVLNESKSLAQANAIQTSLARIGVKVEISALPSGDLYALLFTPQKMRDQGVGLAMTGFNSGWPTPAGVLAVLADGRRITAADNRNLAELNDAAVNTALDSAFLADMTDSAGPADASGAAGTRWNAAERAVLDSASYIPLVYDKVTNVYSANLTNVYYQPAYDSIEFAALGVR